MSVQIVLMIKVLFLYVNDCKGKTAVALTPWGRGSRKDLRVRREAQASLSSCHIFRSEVLRGLGPLLYLYCSGHREVKEGLMEEGGQVENLKSHTAKENIA